MAIQWWEPFSRWLLCSSFSSAPLKICLLDKPGCSISERSLQLQKFSCLTDWIKTLNILWNEQPQSLYQKQHLRHVNVSMPDLLHAPPRLGQSRLLKQDKQDRIGGQGNSAQGEILAQTCAACLRAWELSLGNWQRCRRALPHPLKLNVIVMLSSRQVLRFWLM